MATEGTFVLADIGGYTKFLTGVGIQHAKEVTEHLLNRLIKSTDRRQAIPLSGNTSRCELRAIFKPAIPVVSTLIRPIFIRLMKSDISKDMAGLKELCETGKVADRQAQAAKSAA